MCIYILQTGADAQAWAPEIFFFGMNHLHALPSSHTKYFLASLQMHLLPRVDSALCSTISPKRQHRYGHQARQRHTLHQLLGSHLAPCKLRLCILTSYTDGCEYKFQMVNKIEYTNDSCFLLPAKLIQHRKTFLACPVICFVSIPTYFTTIYVK